MDDKNKESKPLQLQIQLDDNEAQGRYCNMSMVNHNPSEFTMDFAYIQPQQPRAKVRARVIMSPLGIKRFLNALEDNVRRYERRYGEIIVPPGPEMEIQ